jgi:hemolysin D
MISHSNLKSNHGDPPVVETSQLAAQPIDHQVDFTPEQSSSFGYSNNSDIFSATEFQESVIFQQSQVWSRAIAGGIIGLIIASIGWAAVARLDKAIAAPGKLEPINEVRKIQVPLAGVVKQIYVKNGDQVQAGDLLLRLESNIPESQLTYLANTQAALTAENNFYRAKMQPITAIVASPTQLQINPAILALTQNRDALITENQVHHSEMSGKSNRNLTIDQQNRLLSSANELQTRQSAEKIEISKVQSQISGNRLHSQDLIDQLAGIKSNIASIAIEIANVREGVATALSQIDRQIFQNQSRMTATQQSLRINQGILADIRPAGEAGAIAPAQIKRQEQEVISRVSELEQQIQEQSRLQLEKQRLISNNKADTQRQKQRSQEQQQLIKQRQAEIGQLDQEYARLRLSVNQGIEKLNNNVAVKRSDLFTKIANNEQKIAEINSQLNKSIIDNEKKIAEITNQINQAQQNLKYQEIRSPVAGQVFELKAYVGGVINNNSSEAVVQIIPNNDVVAKVYITNENIGFVKPGQPVDVRIDTFDFSEFGDVKGTIEWIGSDALPPDQLNPARFPAKIKLAQQTLTIKKGVEKLRPGMSVQANIKLRDRTVISLVTEMFTKQSDGLKNLR